MADQLRTTFSEIADAIRTQSGTTEPISARNFASSILDLNTGAGGSKITVYTLILPYTAVPVDSTTMIENIYFNTSLSEAEVISIIDNAFASVPDWPEEMESTTYIFLNETNGKNIILGSFQGSYLIQAFTQQPTTDEERDEVIAFISGPAVDEAGVVFTGWNPNFSGEVPINETNAYIATMTEQIGALEQFQQLNEALKELISSTPF